MSGYSIHAFTPNYKPHKLMNMESELPVLIVGAGISGLLLAQQLRQLSIPFKIFERDSSFTARGAGWGLTLHWSVSALRELLPEHLLPRLRDTYVDREAVERGEDTTFPFFDLTTGQSKGGVPRTGESQRIRVSRERLRQLLVTQIDVQWDKTFKQLSDYGTSVCAHFEDGTSYRGRMLFGCDGSHSQVRREMFGVEKSANLPLPISMFGFTMQVTAEQAAPIRALDPFVLQGTASANDVSMYTSVLQAPPSTKDVVQNYIYQVCISGSTDKAPFRSVATRSIRPMNDERIVLIRDIAQSFAEPFRSFISLISDDTTVQQLDLDDWALPDNHLAASTHTLVGDAAHAMTMFLGAGANHAIVDVLELKHMVLSKLGRTASDTQADIEGYQRSMATRTRPSVLASRKACFEAHDWANLTSKSHLLSARQMVVDFDDQQVTPDRT